MINRVREISLRINNTANRGKVQGIGGFRVSCEHIAIMEIDQEVNRT